MFKDSIFVLFYFSYIQSNLSLLVVRQQESFLSETRIKVKTPKNPVSSGRTLTSLLVFLPLDACLNTRSHSTLTKWVDQSVFFLNTRSAGRCRFLAHSAFLQVRVDSGIQEGSDISIYYDPMISKVSDILDTKCNHSVPKFICIRSLKEVAASQMTAGKTAVANSLYSWATYSRGPD